MTSVSVHNLHKLSAQLHRYGGSHWVTLQCDEIEIQLFGRSDGQPSDSKNPAMTVEQIADVLGAPGLAIAFEEQCKQHDEDESNTLPMTHDPSPVPF